MSGLLADTPNDTFRKVFEAWRARLRLRDVRMASVSLLPKRQMSELGHISYDENRETAALRFALPGDGGEEDDERDLEHTIVHELVHLLTYRCTQGALELDKVREELLTNRLAEALLLLGRLESDWPECWDGLEPAEIREES